MIRLLSKLIAIGAFAALFGGHAGAFAQQDALKRVDELLQLSQLDNRAALAQVEEFGKTLGPATPYLVMREYLNVAISVHWEAGKLPATRQAVESLRQLAEANKDEVGIVLATVREAQLMDSDGKSGAALAKLNEIEKRAVATKNPDVLWRYYVTIGDLQLVAGRFEEALTHILKSMEYAKARSKMVKVSQIASLQSLSSVYGGMQNWEKALSVLDEALALADGVVPKKTQGSLYLARGSAYTSVHRYKEAMVAYNKSLQIATEAGLLTLQATSLNNIGDLYLIEKNYPKAEVLERQALAKYIEAVDPSGAAMARCNVGFALMGQGKVKEGVPEVRTCLAYFAETGARSDEEAILDELGRMFEQLGLHKEAVETIRQQQKLSKALFRQDREKSVATLQEQFDTVQRQKQIELLARENSLKDAEISNRRLQQIITMLGACVTVMAGFFVYLLYRKVRKTNEKLREANQQLEFHSVRDPLTGLYNRRSFLELMKQRPAEAHPTGNGERREDIATDGLMVLDIDHFKNINDTLGHAGGDIVLVEIAKRLRSTVRDSDMVMRWGGEEFLVYSPKASAVHLKALAQRILNAVGTDPITVGEKSLTVTVTGGFLSLPFSGLTEQECNWEKAMQIADMALYLGKTHGRNRAYGLNRLLVPFEQAMPVLEHDIASALEANMVELVEVVGPPTATGHA